MFKIVEIDSEIAHWYLTVIHILQLTSIFVDDQNFAINWKGRNNHHNHLFVHQYLFFVKNSSTFLSATHDSHLQSFDILGILIVTPIETWLLDEVNVEELLESKINVFNFLSFRRLFLIPIFLMLMVNHEQRVDFQVQLETSTVVAINPPRCFFSWFKNSTEQLTS